MAHLWFDLAATGGDEDAIAARDRIAASLSPADLSEARRRAQVCRDSGYRDCD
jgi:hypothetical protein